MKRRGCTREADWNVPRRGREHETEEKKGKERRTKLFEGDDCCIMLVSQVHYRRNVLCCDDSILHKLSMVEQRNNFQQHGNGQDFTHCLFNSSHNLVLCRLPFNKMMSSVLN